jgi:outer membrane protein assembly factor BamB
MKRSHFDTKTALIRAIPLLLLFWTAVSFAEPHKILNSNSSAKPNATGDWPQAFFNAAHTGNNRFETQLNRRNVRNLTQLWASPVGLGVLYTSPVVSNGKVYIGSGSNNGDDHIYAFDALTGATLWVGAQQAHFFLNSAAVGHGLVFAAAYISPLIAYDADTGEIVWTSDIPDVARAGPGS